MSNMDKTSFLEKQIEVDKLSANAIDKYYRDRKFDISPAPVFKKSAEEELKDALLQRDIALKTLRSFLNEKDATTVMFNLQEDDDILVFNRFARPFLRQIKDQQGITPAIFDDLWEKYKMKLAATQYTDINIPVEKEEFDTAISGISDTLDDVQEEINKTAMVVLPFGVGAQLAKMRDDAKELAGDDIKTLDRKFNDALEFDFKRPARVGDVIEIPTSSSAGLERWTISKSPTKTGMYVGVWYLAKAGGKPLARHSEKIQYMIFKKYGVPYGQKITWTGDPSTVFIKPAKAGPMSGLPSTATVGRPALGTPTGTGIEHPRRFYKIGSGFVDIAQMPQPLKIDEHKRRPEALKRQNPNFGSYVISLNALKKGYLHIRYPSGANIPGVKKVIISSVLKKIINDIIFEKRFEESDYEQLGEAEKKLFDDALMMCKIDDKDCKLIYKHKKYNDKERDEMVNRFNILKGEIIAGNDNPSLVKELKALLFKMQSEKVISRTDYTRIMEKLITLD